VPLWNSRERWNDPEFRQRRLIDLRAQAEDPVTREKKIVGLKKAYKKSSAMRRGLAKGRLAAARKKQGIALRKTRREHPEIWMNPATRAAHRKALKAAWARRRA
jgi:hypothetical protein